MRRVLSVVAAFGLLGSLGCIHETCDCVPDLCCGHHVGRLTSPAALPAPGKAEELKKPPAAKGAEAPKPAAEEKKLPPE